MATILESVNFSCHERPKYSSYQLSRMVEEKRHKLGMSISDIAKHYNIDSKVIELIESKSIIFNTKMYKACSTILEKGLDELLSNVKDDESAISFRTTGNNENLEKTLEVTDKLFHEMIYQRMIATR